MASKTTAGGAAGATSVITIALCFLAAVFEGFDLQAAGIAAPRLGPAFGMTPDQLGWFFSASTFGLMIGAVIGGRLSDRFGRKAVLIGSIAVFGAMSVCTALSHSVEALLLFRFLTGLGLGGAFPNFLALVAENSAPGRKNTFVALLYAGMPFGGALAALSSLLGGADDWQIVFHIGGFAPLLLVPLLMFFLPESRELQALKAETPAGPQGPQGFLFALFQENRALRTILLWVAFFMALVTMYVLLNWLPTLLVSRGLTRPEASMVQISFNLCAAASSVLTGLLMDRISLSKVVAISFGAAAAGLVVLAIAPAVIGISLIVGGLVGATISMTQALLYALAPATYPTAVRGAGVGAAVSAGRLGSTAGPLLAAALIGGGATAQEVLAVLIPTILAGGVAAFLLSLRMGAAERRRIALAEALSFNR
jgi:AAHS family 3-hydroxyphenylpropionic acid transporter